MGLTAKQEKFIHEYLICYNATRAAKLAGYRSTEGSLAVSGHRLLRKANISEAIRQHLQESAMTADEAIMRISAIARGGDGVGTGQQLKALQIVCKIHGLFTHRIEHTSQQQINIISLTGLENQLQAIWPVIEKKEN